MIATDLTASPELLCKALLDVTALTFNPKDESELAAAAVLVKKLMDNFDLATALAESVAKNSLIKSVTDEPRKRFAHFSPLVKVPAIHPDADILSADLPTESSSELHPEIAHATQESFHFFPKSFPISASDAVTHRDNLLVFYSPEVLGFSSEGSSFDWSNQTETKWGHFLHLAELKISRPKEMKAKGKTDFLKRAWERVRDKTLYSTEHLAKNYSIVELKAGAGKFAVHFLYESTSLYVVVMFNETTTLHSKVHAEDIEDFAKNMVNAFGGHEDFAKGALTSLRQELSH